MRTEGVRKYMKHRYYDDDTMEYDIAIALARNAMQLGRFVKRIALMGKYPQQPSAGYMAGWGVINVRITNILIKILNNYTICYII